MWDPTTPRATPGASARVLEVEDSILANSHGLPLPTNGIKREAQHLRVLYRDFVTLPPRQGVHCDAELTGKVSLRHAHRESALPQPSASAVTFPPSSSFFDFHGVSIRCVYAMPSPEPVRQPGTSS